MNAQAPIPMLLWCPQCHERHIDVGEFAYKPHETHSCQHCGMVWKPAKVPTCGVQFLPGYSNEHKAETPAPRVRSADEMTMRGVQAEHDTSITAWQAKKTRATRRRRAT